MEGPSERLKNSSVILSEKQAESLTHVGNVIEHGRRLRIVRTEDDRYFCELEKRPDRQAAAAILLKGIVPVCDIKMVKDANGIHYYSYMVPIENELQSGEHTDEIEADRAVIDLLFNGEHWAGKLLKNVRLDKNNQAVFFDFDQTKFDLSLDKERVRDKLRNTQEYYPSAIKLIQGKLLALRTNLDGQAGRDWFYNALKHIGYDPQNDDVSLTYEEHKIRLERGLEKAIKDRHRPDTDELLVRLRNKVDEILDVLSEISAEN